MEATKVTCPECHSSFALTEALAQPIVDRLRDGFAHEITSKLDAQRKQLLADSDERARESVKIQLTDLQQQLQEKSRLLQSAQQQQLDLLRQRRELESQKSAFELEKIRQIELERRQIAEKAAKDAREKIDIELSQLKQAIASKEDEFRLREAEKTKQLEDSRRINDELRRKLEQGSQQNQGEVLELDLENSLRRCFSGDEITPVAKGIHGGDLLQKVRDEFGRECGTIIWEMKRTKNWLDSWLVKLKDDKLAAKAQVSILISVTMPRDVATFECRQNVWIAPPNLAVALAAALRMSLIETAGAKRAAENRHDKMAVVYDYLAGSEFKGRVTAIFEAFTAMRKELEGEKNAMRRIWAAREKQIERVLGNTIGLHGDLQGMIGNSLPAIDGLQLTTIADEAEQNASAPAMEVNGIDLTSR